MTEDLITGVVIFHIDYDAQMDIKTIHSNYNFGRLQDINHECDIYRHAACTNWQDKPVPGSRAHWSRMKYSLYNR